MNYAKSIGDGEIIERLNLIHHSYRIRVPPGPRKDDRAKPKSLTAKAHGSRESNHMELMSGWYSGDSNLRLE